MKQITMKKLVTTLVIILVILLVFLLLGPFYIVNEGEQAVVTRFGKIVDTQKTAGLKFKMPVVDNVVVYPKKILSWDGDAQRIPTKENQFIWVDTTARWKIVDPVKFYESVNTVDNGRSRLNDILDSSIRTIVSDNYLSEAVRNSNQINGSSDRAGAERRKHRGRGDAPFVDEDQHQARDDQTGTGGAQSDDVHPSKQVHRCIRH